MKISVMTPQNVDFDQPERCAQTQPLSCEINGQIVLPKKMNWSQLLVAITERFIGEGNPHLAVLETAPLLGGQVFFLTGRPKYGTCALLTNGKWISTNHNSQTIVVLIRNLCRHCGVDLKRVSISFMPEDMENERIAKKCEDTKLPARVINVSEYQSETLMAISETLLAHFPNGFRVDSPIELMRFRNFATNEFANGIPLADNDLLNAINLCGTLFEGKVYIVPKEIEARIKKEIDTAIVDGAKLFYYSSVYARFESWLFAGRIISDPMLKEILKRIYPSYQHKASYFSTNGHTGVEPSVIKNEILRVWNGDILLSYGQISERLPYIPLDKIKLVLNLSGDFIWNSTEVYTHSGMVDISDEERAKIEEYVATSCRTNGYASMNDVPLKEIEEHNNELTLTAIHNAVFTIVLSGKYDKRGKIITRKGDVLDALTIMKEHCRSIEKCSLQNLLDFERDLIGETQLSLPLEAAYSIMVRIAEDTFVAEKFVNFDVDKIDETIDIFVTGRYLPLKSITTFVAFPHCGQIWNLFLLESYCRRFSRRFRVEGLAVNSRNAGTIVRKNCDLAYSEILADAVAASGVDLNKADVLEFLCNTGYIGRKSSAKIGEIIEQAKTLRERRV